jgi:hypothetical protein
MAFMCRELHSGGMVRCSNEFIEAQTTPDPEVLLALGPY